jgi:DNA-binding GntR family transcriptional regulator
MTLKTNPAINLSGASSLKTKPRAADQIYLTLKEEILSGEIGTSKLLSENEIARRFQVSRTPVREALGRLVCDGLVQVLPQRGHQVRTIPFSEVLQAFRLRELLEVEAAGEAALNITGQDIQKLTGIVSDPEDAVLANYKFHTTVAQIGGNRLLVEMLEELLTLMQSIILLTPTLYDPDPELKIIAALATRNPQAAREAMRTHIYESRDLLMNFYNRRGDINQLNPKK